MKGLDTKALVLFLAKDDEMQAQAVRKLMLTYLKIILIACFVLPSMTWAGISDLSLQIGGWKDENRLSLELSQTQIFKTIDFDKKRLRIGTEEALSFHEVLEEEE